ncbi:MAG: hypothetical protein H0T42_31090 [Deltaproteobacteria bacterium]|nr:hypothetical protein [Deltaproteobacteria bacterium]
MSKDRARPFSRKHRKYWIPVTGGMLLIGVMNVGIGFCAYESPPPPPEQIIPVLPPRTAPPPSTDGSIGLGAIPAVVMRAFNLAYPRHAPSAAKKLNGPDGTTVYEISFTSPATTVVYREDGTFVSQR